MPSDSKTLSELLEAVESMRLDMARLADRVALLESAATATEPPQPLSPFPRIKVTSDDPTVAKEGLSEEVLLAISAAVAQYLGVQPRVRKISLVGGATWAQQGRATIQASHTLTK